jgi:hypothetical protein
MQQAGIVFYRIQLVHITPVSTLLSIPICSRNDSVLHWIREFPAWSLQCRIEKLFGSRINRLPQCVLLWLRGARDRVTFATNLSSSIPISILFHKRGIAGRTKSRVAGAQQKTFSSDPSVLFLATFSRVNGIMDMNSDTIRDFFVSEYVRTGDKIDLYIWWWQRLLIVGDSEI